MCGIAGAVRPGGASRQVLARMAGILTHRGPDSDGFHERADIGLAVRRLRVIDLVTGDQPIRSACSGATIVYNGELYNYRELRTDLEQRGHRFTTASDNEVVLHFY
jgi:asparagine synthase (glutamine-hydrolysing)